jgi:hypothetical protein
MTVDFDNAVWPVPCANDRYREGRAGLAAMTIVDER